MKQRLGTAKSGFWVKVLVALALVGVTPGSCESLIERELGIATLPQTAYLDVSIEPQARCFFGDLDVIYRDSRRLAEKGRILLTIESLSKDKATPAVALHEIFGGSGFNPKAELELSDNIPDNIYSLVLCSDHSGEAKNCRNAELVPFDQLLAPYKVAVSDDGKSAVTVNGSPGILSSDRVYFSKPVVIANNKIHFATKAGRDDLDEAFGSYVTSLLQKTPPSDWVLGRIRYQDQALGSIPLNSSDGALQISLPYYSPAKCGWVAEQVQGAPTSY